MTTLHPWPFSEGFEFTKAKPWRPGVDASTSTAVEVKYDGWRGLAVMRERRLRLYTRGVSVVTGTWRDVLEADHKQPGGSIEAIDDLVLCEGDAVELELTWPGHEATEIPTALADPDKRNELVAACFGYPWAGGRKLATWDEQRQALEDEERPTTKLFGYEASTCFATLEEAWRYARRWDAEGFIVKERREGGRWWKIKERATMDCVVVGSTDAEFGVTGKFAGLVGSLILAVRCRRGEEADYDVGGIAFKEIACVSGMDDAERVEMSADRESLVGRVCEVEYQSRGSRERLRHPQFVRWREDKRFEDCIDDRPSGPVGGESSRKDAT